ncbi:class I adenylate-forming enzyme family protein [Sphingosinicella sp. YJ22]|uniref:class I adenylate-forming enzyme family protein n=1 Tax=Sphingosinicella sp. YJ22 TaxID=1104780 RepID=UPI001A9CB844|nr:class I adenylate-forming enzyme family protein [Sphingosinicella sp. YJ22]
MPTELDRKMDQMIAAVTGEGGPIKLGTDDQGRVIVTNLPPTLPIFFDAFCMLNQSSEAIVADGERLTFGDLLAYANRLAPVLAGGFGINKGDRVAIAMRNCPAWILTYMAVVKAGGVATLINGWWQPHELEHGLKLTEPKLVIADAARAERVAATGLGIETVTLPVDRPAAEALAPLLDRGGDAELPQIGPDDDATILFTSGSTGTAKGALSTHRAVTTGTYTYSASLAALKAILESEGRPPANPPRTLINVPLFHVTGEVPVMLNSFVINRCMVLMKKWDAGEALRLIQDEKITYFVGVPTMSLELMQHPDRETYDLSTLTDLAAGGAPRPAAHVARLREAFKTAQPALGYGLTETNAVGCGNVWSNYAAKPDSTGRPQRPLVDLVILGPDDRPLPAGERGEIAIRSAANFKEYWRDAAATAAAFTADGYVRSGDIGYLDEDDYLFIVDRKKDIIIRGGENIACPEVEAALYSHAGVDEASVFGIPDERLGEVPVAVVHLADGQAATEDELRDHVAGLLAPFKVPAAIVISAEPLPKLGTGKFDKVTLRQRYKDLHGG